MTTLRAPALLLGFCCALLSASASAQETTVAQSRLDNITVQTIDLNTSLPTELQIAGRSTNGYAYASNSDGNGSSEYVTDLLFPVPLNLQQARGAVESRATMGTHLGEIISIGSLARGENSIRSDASGRVRYEFHVLLEANSALLITGDYSASVLSGTAGGVLPLQGYTYSSVDFHSISTPGIDASFREPLFGQPGTFGGSVSDAFQLYAQNNLGYAVEGVVVFESYSVSNVTAVPEPGTWMMLSGGLLLLGAARRRTTRS